MGAVTSTGRSVGDDFATFVSSDGNTYITTDDGQGFASSGTTNANMQINVLTNESTFAANNVNALTNYGAFSTFNGTDGPSGRALSNKQTGLFGMAGNLYMFQNRSDAPGTGHPTFQEYYGNIMMSPDHGATWNSWQAPGTFNANGVPPSPLGSFQFDNGNIGTISPVRYAADDGTMGYLTAGNRIDGADAYVYIYYQTGSLQAGSTLFLLRVSRAQFSIQSSNAFQYWIGPTSPTPADFVNDSNWGAAASATSIYSAANAVGNGDIVFIPGLNRYLMLNWYYPSIGATAPVTSNSVWNFLEAPTPAGPWTQFFTQANNPTGYYMPRVMHRDALTNSALTNIPLTLIFTDDYNNSHGLQYARFTLNMPISFIQSKATPGFPSGSSQSVTYTSNVTQGNLLVAFSWGNANPTGISDTMGNSWTQAIDYNGLGSSWEGIWYCIAKATGANTVTISQASSTTMAIAIAEFNSSTSQSWSVDVAAVGAHSSGTTATTASVNTAFASELVLSSFHDSNLGTTSAPFTAGDQLTGAGWAYYIPTTTQTGLTSSQTGLSGVWAALIMSFYNPASGGGSGSWTQGHRNFINKRG